MGYSYDYYSQICFLLRDKGFYPKNILDIGASVCQTADIMRQVWPVANILLFEGNNECEKLYQKLDYQYQIKLLGKINMMDNVIDVACERSNYDFALDLARTAAKHKLADVYSKVRGFVNLFLFLSFFFLFSFFSRCFFC